MPNEDPATVQREGYVYFIAVVVTLVVSAAICFFVPQEHRVLGWLAILVLMVVGFALIGKAITGVWRGILIDSRNRMSLSRLQLLSWTLIIFSGLLVAAVFNARLDWSSPLDIVVPDQIWIVLGLATTSAVAAPVILNTRRRQQATEEQVNAAADTIAAQNAVLLPEDTFRRDVLDRSNRSVVVRYRNREDARWADLFKGEEIGNADSVDTGKIQLFFLTFVLILAYGTAIYTMLRQPGIITSMPDVREGLSVLLGISQTGYLATKSIPHTPPPN